MSLLVPLLEFNQYLKATGLANEPGSLLFPAAVRKTGKLSRRPLARTDAADMLKRRLKQAGLPVHYSPHSFRATGITNMAEIDPNSYALHTLYLAINRQKNLLLWKVRLPGPEDKINTWHSSAREAAEFAMKTWVKVVPNMGNRCYEYFEPVANLSEPEWPKLTLREILKLAFKGLVIEGPDHEVLKRFRGEI